METRPIKLDIGAGKSRREGFTSVDIVPPADIVVNLEHERLPFEDNSVDEIACYETLEHISHSRENPDGLDALIFVMNEMHRVLKPGCLLHGKVPGTDDGAFADPTHQRYFRKSTFDYFSGARPKNADYGIKPWKIISVDNGIRFTLTPNK